MLESWAQPRCDVQQESVDIKSMEDSASIVDMLWCAICNKACAIQRGRIINLDKSHELPNIMVALYNLHSHLNTPLCSGYIRYATGPTVELLFKSMAISNQLISRIPKDRKKI